MTSIPAVTDKRLDLALLVLRLVIGTIFIAHGWQKVFVYHITGVTVSFTQMGIPMAGLVAPFVSVLELIGGIALLLGAFTRIAASLIAIDMLCAIVLVHSKGGLFVPKGVEFVLGNFATLVALALVGAGAYSVDAMMARRGERAP
jgi:putative oxidoreductase